MTDEPQSDIAVELATPEALAVAQAKLSEGWCPMCNTRFQPRELQHGDNALRCSTGYSHDAVQAEVEQAATWHAITSRQETNE